MVGKGDVDRGCSGTFVVVRGMDGKEVTGGAGVNYGCGRWGRRQGGT